jgi:hypothetical protein
LGWLVHATGKILNFVPTHYVCNNFFHRVMFLQFVTVHRFQLLYLGNQNIMEEENKHFTSGLKQIVKRSTCLSHTETILVYRIQDVTSTQQFILLAYNLRLPICSMSLQTTFMASRNQIMCFVIPQQVRPFNNLFYFYHLIVVYLLSPGSGILVLSLYDSNMCSFSLFVLNTM